MGSRSMPAKSEHADRSNDRNVSRPSHGDEFCACRFADTGSADRESRVASKKRTRGSSKTWEHWSANCSGYFGRTGTDIRQNARRSDARCTGGLEQLLGPFQQRHAGRSAADSRPSLDRRPQIVHCSVGRRPVCPDIGHGFPISGHKLGIPAQSTCYATFWRSPTTLPRVFPHESVQRRFSISAGIRKYNNLLR